MVFNHRTRLPFTITRFFGGHSEEDPPVPIPNTEVKLFSADGTAWETMWESRSPPIFFNVKTPLSFAQRGFGVSISQFLQRVHPAAAFPPGAW